MLWRNGRVFKLRALNGRLANRCLSEKLNLLNSHCYQLTKTKYDVILITVNYLELPVYKQKQKILDALAVNQVIVVESPTGSGKTTQIPQILYQAGYADKGVIGITQPRRIAAVSVTEYIAGQLGKTIPDTVGYKMRFTDSTDRSPQKK